MGVKFAIMFVTVVLLALASMIGSVYGSVIYVDDDPGCGGNTPCNSTIQSAIDSASGGYTIIVRDGVYPENIEIDKELTIRSENGSANCIIDAMDSGSGFVLSEDGVSLEGFTILNFSRSVSITNASIKVISNNNRITNNTIISPGKVLYYGIYLKNKSNNNITGNNINNSEKGIYLDSSRDNIITNNNISENKFGIYFQWESQLGASENNWITFNNIFSNTNYGIYVKDSSVIVVDENNITKNKEGIYFKNSSLSTIVNNSITESDGNYGIQFEYSDGNSIFDNYISMNENGIALTSSNSNNITSNNLTLNKIGISLDNSDNNDILSNTVRDNSESGINLTSSSLNTIEGNTLVNNTLNGLCIASSSQDNTVSNNDFSDNVNGIYLKSGHNNILSNNFTQNKYGIYINSSDSNTVSGNNATDNNYGIYITESSGNEFSSNIFSDNTIWDVEINESNGNTFSNNNFTSTVASFTYSGDVGVRSVTSTPPASSNPYKYSSIGKYLNITDLSDNAWVFLNFSYSESDAEDVLEDTLKVMKWNGTAWLDSGWFESRFNNPEENIVGANITSFSLFAPFGFNKTIWVPDDYEKIQWAVTNASAGAKIIVRDGTYVENINIYKRLTLMSENGSANCLVGNTTTGSILTVYADYVNISGFTLLNAWYGIDLRGNNSYISNNTFINMTNSGIFLSYSSNNNIIVNNLAIDNNDGIFLYGSYNNLVKDNNLTLNINGIQVHTSSSNRLINNTAINNSVGIYFAGSSNNNILAQNNLTLNNYGVLVTGENNTLMNNNISSNDKYGIQLLNSSRGNFSCNTIVGNKQQGVLLSSNSTGNLFTNNNISLNSVIAILLQDSLDNIFRSNNISGNTYGIRIISSTNNTLYLNNFINNTFKSISDSPNHWNSTDMLFYEFNGTIFKNYLGNYWDDYSGNDTDSNGIGDEPYNITDGTNVTGKDFYPLINSTTSYPPASIPDLIVEDINAPSSMTSGKTYTINVIIANTGNENATSFNLSLKASGEFVDNITGISLNPGVSKSFDFSWKPTEAKSYTLLATVDSDKNVAELNESNNEKSVSVSVSAPSGGDDGQSGRRGGGGGGGGGGLPLPIPANTSTPEPTPKRTISLPSIPISMPKTTPTPEETHTPEPTPTPTPEETSTPKPTPAWWEQPTGSIIISAVVFSAILVAVYIMRRK